ncbi:MAG: molybdopterin-dependent oxidoreductase [Thermodesulfobacteriota bacterium]
MKGYLDNTAMAKLTIDGREIEVEDGLNIIQAAARLDIEIPHFCYHPALSVVAQCRQCLVEVEGVPKVMPACSTFVRDGLNIKTDSEKAVKAQRATVEFTLINHPLDCPICDKGGECPLQLTTFKHGPGYSRFEEPEEKRVRKKYPLGERIMYDPNRCIMCTRCVRFTDEVTGTGELGYQGRGFKKKIVVFPGSPLDNELAGNVIDLCPVGALLSRDSLHEERVWYWKFTDTVCSLCSNGCNITVGVDPRRGRISRVRPRVNPEVNGFWICDTGRYGFKDAPGQRRLMEPLLRVGEGFEPRTWQEVLEATHTRLEALRREDPGSVAIVGSALMTNEELYLLQKISIASGIPNLVVRTGTLDAEKKFGIISTDPFPNSAGARDLGLNDDIDALASVIEGVLEGKLSGLYVAGVDLFDLVPEEAKAKLRESLVKLRFLAVQDFRVTETTKLAAAVLPGASPYEKEGTFTNDEGRVQKLNIAIPPPGDSKPDWEILTLLGTRFRDGGFKHSSPSEIAEEIAKQIPSYSNISYEKIGSLGMMREDEHTAS